MGLHTPHRKLMWWVAGSPCQPSDLPTYAGGTGIHRRVSGIFPLDVRQLPCMETCRDFLCYFLPS
nr:MAG TPA: hypothetical protein [Caudoviricetes sp.]